MTYLIIGSTAAKYWFEDFPRNPKDKDLISWHDHPGSGYDVYWNPRLKHYLDSNLRGYRMATPDELYTIKVSHSYWELKNGSWNKHIFDILWLQEKGAQLVQEFHDILYKCWEEKYGKKKVNLDMGKESFFADAVKRLYDHDSIHESVAYGSMAMYRSVLAPDSTVAVDMARIKALPMDEKIKLYREEIAATALERWIIPSDYRFSPGLAWKLALKKTITSLTKGWSAQFLVENLPQFVTPDDYTSRHLTNTHKLIKL